MSLHDVLAGSGGALIILATLIQIAPININPWGAFARWIGRALNSDVLNKLNVLDSELKNTRDKLDGHIREDNKRDADMHRQRILRFNSDLMSGKNFTHEYFIDMLTDIDEYERYCEMHSDYRNNRATMAISNIKRVCAEKEKDNSFLKS